MIAVESIARPVAGTAAPAHGRLCDLVDFALDCGMQQAATQGPAFQPFLLLPGDAPEFLFGDERSHPIERAVRRLLAGCRASDAPAVALVMGSRLPLPTGGHGDAVLSIACRRGAAEGEAWARAFVPRRWYRPFQPAVGPWRVGPAINLFQAASQP